MNKLYNTFDKNVSLRIRSTCIQRQIAAGKQINKNINRKKLEV